MISKIASGLVLIAFTWYFVANLKDFEPLLSISPEKILFVGVGYIISICINGYFIAVLSRGFSDRVGFSDGFLSSILSATGNFFFFTGTGSALQAKYLKSQSSFNYKNYLSALSGSYILIFLITALLGLISVIALRDVANTPVYWMLVVFFGLIAISMIYLTILGTPQFIIKILSSISVPWTARVIRIATEVIEGWNIVVRKRRVLAVLAILSLFNFAVSMLISYASISAIGLEIGVWQLVLYSVLGSLTILINITPGSLGIREAMYIFTSSMLGFSASEIIAIGIVDRGVRFLVLLLMMAIFYKRMSKAK